MRTLVQRDDFARLLATNIKVVQSRNTIPILGFVRLAFDGSELQVRSTDLDIDFTSTMPAEGEPGEICVDGKLLSDIVRKAGDKSVSMELKDGRLTVRSGRSTFKLETLPATDFPELGQPQYDAEFDVDLSALVAPVAFAMSSEETRFYLCGVLLHVEDGRLIAVATDGHRLARNAIPYDGQFGNGIIIPAKTIALLPKGVVSLAVSDTKIKLTVGSTVIVSKLVDGTYPDYQRVIPKKNTNRISFDRDAMMKAADRVSTVSAEKGRGVKLAFADNEVTLSMRSTGEAEDAVAVAYDGLPTELGLNGAYLREILSVMPVGEVTMALGLPGVPALLTTDNAPEWTGLLMEMRV